MTMSICGPAWDLSGEYSGTGSAELTADLVEVGRLLDQSEADADKLATTVPAAEALSVATAAPSPPSVSGFSHWIGRIGVHGA